MTPTTRRAGLWAYLKIALFWLLMGSVGWAQSNTIREIRVEGNQRVETETVRSYMRINVGDAFDPDLIDRGLKSLFATGLFADVNLRREREALVVTVVENPIINRVAFEGNKKIETKNLEQEVQVRARTVYTRARVQSDVNRILEIYRRTGRFAATVDPKVIRKDQNRVDLVFEIDEGPATSVRKITFIGNKRFGDDKLRRVVQTKESRWYRFFSSDDTYDPDRLTFDRELLRDFYLSEGYADFRVVSAVAELTPDRQDFFVTFSVDEGERYRLGKVAVDSKLRGVDGPSLMPLVMSLSGDWYDSQVVEKSIQKLTDAIGSQGYAFVDVRPQIERKREAQIIDVTYEVGEGPKVFVERINIQGNVRTLDKVVRREFRLAEGDAFNTAKVRRSRTRIRGLGFFEKVDITNRPGSSEDRTVIDVDVAEKSTGEISFGFGFSTVAGLLGDVGIRERNLLGKGQDLNLRLSLSTRRSEIDLSFTEPYFLDRNLAAGFDLFRRSDDVRRESSFKREMVGFALRAGYPVTERLRHRVIYSLRQIDITDVKDTASRFIREQEGQTVTSSVGHAFTFDARDDKQSPTEGYVFEFGQDVAGLGGDSHYLRNRIEYAQYWPIPWTDNWVGKIALEEGYIVGIGEDIRIADRFFLGGSTFRGFASGGLGPRDVRTDDALGGNAFWKGTLETTFPLGAAQDLGLQGRVFSDIGTLGRIDQSGADLVDTGSIRASVGAGVIYRSPFGPISIDFAWAVKREEFDDPEIIQFSFGTRF